MVLRWFFDVATIAFNCFRWFQTIGQKMRWFRWIVVVYCGQRMIDDDNVGDRLIVLMEIESKKVMLYFQAFLRSAVVKKKCGGSLATLIKIITSKP